MIVYDLKTMSRIEINENTIVALGTFDGCHYAHRKVLSEAFYEAKRQGIKSVAYTFSSIPKNSKSIFTLEEKIKAFSKIGIDYVAVESFDEIKNLSSSEFFENVLIGSLKAVGASCGYNYKFGKGASANATDLEQMFSKTNGGSVKICEKIAIDNTTVSSSHLRSLIENGKIEELDNFGTKYTVYAKVEAGKQLGSKIGFPTINQKIPDEKIVPKRGVYITECEIGEDVYPSVTNVGIRPSIDDGNDINMETFIIGYSGILYHSYIKVNFYKYLREEVKFNSLEELTKQIGTDAKKTEEYFK